jgi:hypothetical protein
VAGYIQADRLKEAEQERLINRLKAESAPVKSNKRLWRFRIKDDLTMLVGKIIRPRRLRSSSNG